MRVLVTKLQKVERVAFAPEGTHLFASGLHAGSLGYGTKDTGIDVFDLAGGSEPAAHLFAWRDVHEFHVPVEEVARVDRARRAAREAVLARLAQQATPS